MHLAPERWTFWQAALPYQGYTIHRCDTIVGSCFAGAQAPGLYDRPILDGCILQDHHNSRLYVVPFLRVISLLDALSQRVEQRMVTHQHWNG